MERHHLKFTIRELSASVLFGEADLGNLRIRESDVRHRIAGSGVVPWQKRVPDCLKALPAGQMTELRTPDHIARSVDVLHRCLQMLVDLNAALGVADACCFEFSMSALA